MTQRIPKVGDRAPRFTLRAAQGGVVDLAQYHGQRNVILWFTKGFACPFCRQQMSQLAQAAPMFRARDAEVLQITTTPIERATLYARKFQLPFLYLCDEGDQTRQAYGLAVRRNDLRWYVTKFVRGKLRTPRDAPHLAGSGFWYNAVGVRSPSPRELQRVFSDEDVGFFIIDRNGVVRFVETGGMRDQGGLGAVRPLPERGQLLRILDEECRVAET